MSVCILLTSLNDEGKRQLREHPEKIEESNKIIEATGIKILGQYALIGQYDFLEIFEGESKDAMCQVGLNLSNRGISQTIALLGMTLDELQEVTNK